MLNSTEYFNRDLSWLQFNERVLQEAADQRNPLYERLKFLAIFSSNLDEFFKVRVSSIRRIRSLKKGFRKKLVTKPNKLLKQIKKLVHEQQTKLGEIFEDQIVPQLKKEGIQLIDYQQFDSSQKRYVESYYQENFKNTLVLKKDMDSNAAQLFFENEKLYLIALVDKSLFSVRIPDNTSRFIILPMKGTHHVITYVDDVLKHNLSKEFGTDFYSIKLSRDAELYIDDEYSGNLLEKIKKSLSKRDLGQVTRTLIDQNLPDELLEKLTTLLDINETDLIFGGVYHNFKDFFGFPNPTQKQLSYQELPPKKQKELSNYPSMFKAIDDKDRLLYFPYESFDSVIEWVNQAAEDPKVTKIKITLYRVSKDSAIADALLLAAKNGKDVCVFIETKARFDEANNIKWGKILEDNNAKVIYSYPGIKVHSKIMYIERKENKNARAYGYVGTGNFNEKTSRIYTDFGLMTSNSKITRELLQVFKVLERELIIPKTKRLLVSPFTSRSTFVSLIETEISNAQSGTEAHIILKLNSLEDKKMINLLYKASNAGVCIRLIIRGICCLIPGVKEQSENIVVTSIVDRFLEHARVYIFGNGGKEKMYIGSADWMTRNLDHRIEVISPILDESVFRKIRDAIQLQIDDHVKARIIDAKQSNIYLNGSESGKSSQLLTYDLM